MPIDVYEVLTILSNMLPESKEFLHETGNELPCLTGIYPYKIKRLSHIKQPKYFNGTARSI